MVMQVFNEIKFQYIQKGIAHLAILLLHDFVVVSLLDIVPILGGTGEEPLLIIIFYFLKD
jgi:Kef-type K+ transport system membrane component KefB